MDNINDLYINRVAEKYSIPFEDLKLIWNGQNETTPVKEKPSSQWKVSKSPENPVSKFTAPSTTSQAAGEVSKSELEKLGKAELTSHCKARGLKVTGTKAELIERLTGTQSVSSSSKKEDTKPSKSKDTVKDKAKDGPKDTVPKQIQPELKTLIQAKQPTYRVSKNEFGNYVHTETGLVYSKDKNLFYGRQMPSGTVIPLTTEDIEICNRYKFNYDMPQNLSGSKKDTVNVSELDEDASDLTGEPEEEELEEEELEEEELEEVEEPLLDE